MQRVWIDGTPLNFTKYGIYNETTNPDRTVAVVSFCLIKYGFQKLS